ncbi:helix-turn-helix domain-containing protein [Flavobacterium sp. LS1R49]|uniref:Helix-turn-helix domain-containing protein n=1 Tax=Flavobacterium shii TaxID=2987687 RepID=A0A9X2ZEL2_9FLAO|nr:helix-turn-helix domain-containing protein [Flavobacterium shii]MCV9926273.1 helix-turn-helix domain-containing protein [Flavobacterium shii]
MSLFSDNIRSLRLKKKISQEKVAESLLITRGRYVKYEDGSSEAPYEILKKIAHYYHISIDLLLSVDVRKIPMDDLLKLEGNRLVLPITVSQDGENFIEVVTQKAKAGYLSGYADPEFIESLNHISLPHLGPGKFRAFPIDGDSMPPHKNTTWIVGKYIENLREIRKGKTYILLTFNEGMTYKRLEKKGLDSLTVSSDNINYNPYDIKLSDILEIWEYAAHLGGDDSKLEAGDSESLESVIRKLQIDIMEIKTKISI